MDSSHATINIPSEKHCSNNLVVPEQEVLSSYNIEEVFCSFTFDLHQREVSRKKFRKVKEDDGIVMDINEDDVIFERNGKYSMLVDIASVALSQANIINIYLVNEKIIDAELEKRKLLDEIISLKTKMKKRKNVDDHLILLREGILV